MDQQKTASKDDRRGKTQALLFSVFAIGTCGLIYELLAGTIASYMLGDSVTQFSTIIGVYLFSMGLGSYLARYVRKDLIACFIQIEILVGLIGGISSLVLFLAFSELDAFRVVLYSWVTVTGILVGLEIPLILRILEDQFPFSDLVSKVLSLDYLGALAASLVFPLWLVPQVGLMRSSFIFGFLNVLVAIWMCHLFREEHRRPILTLQAYAALVLLLVGVAFSDVLSDFTEQRLYQDPVIFSRASRYQRVALLRGSKTDPQRPLPTDPLTTDSVRRRPTKLSHLIEDVTCEDGLRLLPRPTARSKALPDDQLVPEEGVLHTGLLMVARVLLPLSPSSLLHLSDRAVARGRSWSPSRHGGCPGRWNDDRRATRTRSLVDATRVVGRVRREAGDVAFDLVDQIEGRRRVVNMPAGQGVSDDHARSVDAQMKLLPAAYTASAMFHGRPFTFTHSREPGTVDDEMYACARGEAAKCKVEVLTTP